MVGTPNLVKVTPTLWKYPYTLGLNTFSECSLHFRCRLQVLDILKNLIQCASFAMEGRMTN